jgi:hypothetical protein
MGSKSDDPPTGRVPATAYVMDRSSQDIFFERIVIQRPMRKGEESFSAFVQKTKPALLLNS